MASGLRDPQLGSDEHVARRLDKNEKGTPRQSIPIYNDLELVSESDLSFAAILKGTAAKPLTTFEKKAALVNAYV